MFRRSPYHQVQPQQAQQQHNHYRFVVVVVFRVATILVMSALILPSYTEKAVELNNVTFEVVVMI